MSLAVFFFCQNDVFHRVFADAGPSERSLQTVDVLDPELDGLIRLELRLVEVCRRRLHLCHTLRVVVHSVTERW